MFISPMPALKLPRKRTSRRGRTGTFFIPNPTLCEGATRSIMPPRRSLVSQKCPTHLRRFRQLVSRPRQLDATILKDIGEVRNLECETGVLLGEQKRISVATKVFDRGKHLLDHDGSKPERGLIEQDHLWPRHQTAPDREHLLLAARHASGQLTPPLAQPGKLAKSVSHPILDTAARARRDPAEAQILLDGQERKDQPAFGNEYDSTVHTPVRRDIDNLPALEAHAARPRRDDPGERSHQLLLPCAVGVAQGGDRTLRDRVTDAVHAGNLDQTGHAG